MHRFRKNLLILGLITATLFISANPCVATDTIAPAMDSYFRVIWGLLIVLGLILLLYGVLRKRFSLTGSSPLNDIQVVEVKPLMGKKALCLVEVRGQTLLLGLSGESVTHLATIEDKTDKPFSEVLVEAENGVKE